MVAFYLDNTFFYDPKIFTVENICHYVEQMFLNNILFFAVKLGLSLPISPGEKLKNYQIW